MSAEILARPEDIYSAGYCAPGARVWFSKHALSWRDFVLQGIDVAVLEAIDDAMAAQVAKHARERHAL